ncbi:MAG: trypsin-like serine protease [bacterium]|nr:trypsin-like serine protease [bacterium]
MELLIGRRATRAARTRRAKRIVNGLSSFKYPSVGALLRGASPASAKIQCSGTLIAANKFLTAAHCIAQSPNGTYWIYLQHAGFFSISRDAQGRNDIAWPEKEYATEGDPADIAILTLDQPVPSIIPMLINGTTERIPFGYAATIAGFGRTGGPWVDYGIKRVGFIDVAECKPSLKPAHHICWNFTALTHGGKLRTNTCLADSGGPLFDDVDHSRLLGITTDGDRRDCGLGDHSWDLKVYRWYEWIKEQGVRLPKNRSCELAPCVDADRHVVGETRRLGNKVPEIQYSIETHAGMRHLMVAMNGEDDGNNTNDFDLFLARVSSGEGKAEVVCKQDGPGQFGFCVVDDPRPDRWQITVRRKQGSGLVQVVVTQLPGPAVPAVRPTNPRSTPVPVSRGEGCR